MPSHFHLVRPFFFSHWNVNYLKTRHFFFPPLHLSTIYICSQFISLCQLEIPRLAAVSVSLRKLEMQCGCSLFSAVCTHWAVSDQCFRVCAWVCTNLNSHACVWTKSSYAWFAFCLFQSSRPILHRGRREAFVKEALGVSLSWPVCFSDTQPGYLTCWWITQAVQSKFFFFIYI